MVRKVLDRFVGKRFFDMDRLCIHVALCMYKLDWIACRGVEM